MSWKLVSLSSVASTIGLMAVSAVAQPPGGGDGQRQPPPFMTALDVNSDGSIDQDEILLAVESLKTLDKDKDGKLSLAELMPAGGRGGPGGGGDRGGPGGGGGPGGFDIMSNDKNNDGFVTKDEFPERIQGFMQGMIDRIDTDKDGKISKAEAEAGRQRPGGFGGGTFGGGGGPGGPGGGGFDIMSNDADKDGFVSKEELGAAMMTRWDTNKDGKISKEEADALRQGGGGRGGDRGTDRPQRPRDDA